MTETTEEAGGAPTFGPPERGPDSALAPEAGIEDIYFPPDVARCLVELARAIQKHTMYPPAHPALRLALEPLKAELDAVLEGRDSLTLVIGRCQIAVEDAETDPEHPVLGSLAAGLHQHELASLTFRAGIGEKELDEFLGLISRDPRQSGRPVGRVLAAEPRAWPHLDVEPADYERLELVWDGQSERAGAEDPEAGAKLWKELAQGLLPGAGGGGGGAAGPEAGPGARPPEAAFTPRQLATALEERSADPEFAAEALERLAATAGRLRTARGRGTAVLRRNTSEIVAGLSPNALRRILAAGDEERRHELLHDAARWMEPTALVSLARATGGVEKRNVSHTLLLLMAKLARYASSDAADLRPEADSRLRRQIDELVTGWDEAESAVGRYREILEQMAFTKPERSRVRERTHGVSPERVLRMALLVNKVGPHVWTALTALMQARRFKTLLDTMALGRDSQAAEELWEGLSRPGAVSWILKEDTPNLDVLDPFVERLGLAAATPLLDGLVAAKSRSVKEGLHARLAALGPKVGPRIAERLEREAAAARRELLALMGELESWEGDWSPYPYVEDPDPEVRREALALLLRDRFHRDRAIRDLLAQDDAEAVGLGLAAAREGAPPEAVPELLSIFTAKDETPGRRLKALQALAPLRPPELVEPLLETVSERRGGLAGLLGRRRIRPKSPLVLEALTALARGWPADARAKAVLDAVLAAEDEEMRQAAAGVETARPRTRPDASAPLATPAPPTTPQAPEEVGS
ncbi:MAG: hypothetical protein ACE5HQ_13120 [Gemmatimonadota bacterium]